MGLRSVSTRAIFVVALIFPTANVFAMSDLCESYRKYQADNYRIYCQGGSGTTKPAGADSTFSDSFNISAASLPTEPSSYGLETIVSSLRSNTSTLSPNFALIKGFHKFGAGISTTGTNTFYGDDVVERLYGTPYVTSFKPLEPSKGNLVNLNLGTSIAIHESPDGGLTTRLGLSARYNNTTATWGGGPALLFSFKNFSVGGGFTHETVSNLIPAVTFVSLLASARFWIFEFEYNRITDDVVVLPLSPVQIYTLTATISRLTLTAAVRQLDYALAGTVSQNHFAAQFLFSSHLSAGVLYNYIPGATSAGLQIYL